ncbi:hypothetical protein U1Q18_009262 [Sarracenia purpurea var. burkii]
MLLHPAPSSQRRTSVPDFVGFLGISFFFLITYICTASSVPIYDNELVVPLPTDLSAQSALDYDAQVGSSSRPIPSGPRPEPQ